MATYVPKWWANLVASYPVAIGYLLTVNGLEPPSAVAIASVLAAPALVPLSLMLGVIPVTLGFASAAHFIGGWAVYLSIYAPAHAYFRNGDPYGTGRLVMRRLAILVGLHVAVTYAVASILVLSGHRFVYGDPVAVIGAPWTVPSLMAERAARANEYFPWEGSGEVMREVRYLNRGYGLPVTFLFLLLIHRRRIRDWYMRPLLEQWRREGRCEHCGYDLIATPARCPECGAPASASPADP